MWTVSKQQKQQQLYAVITNLLSGHHINDFDFLCAGYCFIRSPPPLPLAPVHKKLKKNRNKKVIYLHPHFNTSKKCSVENLELSLIVLRTRINLPPACLLPPHTPGFLSTMLEGLFAEECVPVSRGDHRCLKTKTNTEDVKIGNLEFAISAT